jgi:hypothetical protein
MLGLLLKQFMFICLPSSSQPKYSTISVKMASSVLPCNGSLDVVMQLDYSCSLVLFVAKTNLG